MQKSNYEVEVLVNGKPLKEYIHASKVYVEGREGTSFSLRLRNNSGSRRLFIPSIDGLSVMDGKDCSFDSSGYIVRAHSSITIDGWRVSDNEVAQFFFSSPKDSYRQRMDKGNNLGVIGCAIFDEKDKVRHDCGWSKPINFPNPWTPTWPHGGVTYTTTGSGHELMLSCLSTGDSAARSVNMVSASADLGTGWGDAKRSEVVSVEFEQEAHPSAVVEIYYNTREQLEAMGVDFRKEPLYVTPQAFPGQYCKPPQK